jgi:hypothetical protein
MSATFSTPSTRRVLRDESRFCRLLLAALVSGIGDWFNTVAVLGLMLALTGSGLAVGITLALRIFPRLLVGPIADLLRTPLALAFLLASSPERVWIVYAATTALVILGILNGPARRAVVPGLVRDEHLLAANGLEGTAEGGVMIAGSMLGGLVATAFGAPPAFILNAASFLVSALLTLTIRCPNLHPEMGKGMAARWEVWPVVCGSRLLRLILLLSVLWPRGGAIVNVLVSAYGVQVFAAGNAGVGMLYGAIGAGTVLDGLLAARVARWMRLALGAAFSVEGRGTRW